jgi:hypothetical protein
MHKFLYIKLMHFHIRTLPSFIEAITCIHLSLRGVLIVQIKLTRIRFLPGNRPLTIIYNPTALSHPASYTYELTILTDSN